LKSILEHSLAVAGEVAKLEEDAAAIADVVVIAVADRKAKAADDLNDQLLNSRTF
jgi:hypothetical protein